MHRWITALIVVCLANQSVRRRLAALAGTTR